jgi:hypothetical protein
VHQEEAEASEEEIVVVVEAAVSEVEEEASAVVAVVCFFIILIFLGFDMGPPDYVEKVATFSHACEGMLICHVDGDNVPLLMRNIYL